MLVLGADRWVSQLSESTSRVLITLRTPTLPSLQSGDKELKELLQDVCEMELWEEARRQEVVPKVGRVTYTERCQYMRGGNTWTGTCIRDTMHGGDVPPRRTLQV
jgi:hypothetical protein